MAFPRTARENVGPSRNTGVPWSADEASVLEVQGEWPGARAREREPQARAPVNWCQKIDTSSPYSTIVGLVMLSLSSRRAVEPGKPP